MKSHLTLQSVDRSESSRAPLSFDMRFGQTHVPVLIGTGPAFDAAVDKAIRSLDADRILVVVDPAVAELYPDDLRRFAGLGEQPGVIYVTPEGERCKTFQVLGDVTETFLSNGATKRSLVLSFGGGAVMNLAGLAASLIYRGLRLCHVATTLMAQNDVIPSAKTAINACDRKNNVGAFHAACLNVADTRYLQTLPVQEVRSGMGELVKNALVLGGEHFELAARMLRAGVSGLDESLLAEMVETGIRAKLPLLATDEREAYAGMIFEYGHTVGHALELSYPSGVLPHGLAICWGMLCCSWVSSELGLMSPSEVATHDRLIRQLIPEDLPQPLPSIADVLFRVLRDGKRGRVGEDDQECSCVLLAAVGEPVATETMLSKFPVTLVEDWLRQQGLTD